MNGKVVNIGLIGCGTVGGGVVRLLQRSKHSITQRVGCEVRVKRVCDKVASRAVKAGVEKRIITTDPADIINDPEIDIVIELMGGYEPARRLILRAMEKGKHIVTANKAVLAKYWPEIFTTARLHKVLVYFEASVGAGIPVIQGLNEGLAANKIKEIIGILNGTTNFILTRMTKDGMGFKVAMNEAKRCGFAERDSSFDVEGIDSAHKLAILSSVALGSHISLKYIYCEGITNINIQDINYAKNQFGYVIKLLAIMKHVKGELEVRVHPAFLPADSPLSSVEDEFNAIFIKGDAVSEVMFYGRGAGEKPAASAVVSDVIYLAQKVGAKLAGVVPYVSFDPHKRVKIKDISEIETKYYIHFTTIDRPGVLARISGILGKNDVSIEAVHQPRRSLVQDIPILIVTHRAKEGNVIKALREIDKLTVVRKKSVFIRIEGEE